MYHEIKISEVLDARASPLSSFKEDEVFYVVHEIKVGNAEWFHHSMVIADCAESFHGGIESVKVGIEQELGERTQVVSVFIKNMAAIDEGYIDVESRERINKEQLSAKRARGMNFVVFGAVGGQNVTLISIASKDAASATLTAAHHVFLEHKTDFLPLEIILAGQDLSEIDQYCQPAIANMRKLIAAQLSSLQ